MHVEGQEKTLTWDGMPVGSGKKENLSDSMALNLLFHSLFLCRLGTLGPMRISEGYLDQVGHFSG